MKILLVSLFMPHPKAPHAGGRYVFEILKNLSEKHEVHLVTRCDHEDESLLEDIRPLCGELFPFSYRTTVKRSLRDKLSLIANYLRFSSYAQGLATQGDYDLVQVEWVEAALLMFRCDTPMILDAHDVMAKPFARAAASKNGLAMVVSCIIARAVKFVELTIMRRFDRIVTLSDFDLDYLKKIWPQAPAISIPIPAGLDITETTYVRKPGSILFLASYKYRPVNVAGALWFYREVFPIVKKSVPGATFTIAGYGPPPELTVLESDSSVLVPGFVEDIDQCYKESAVFVAPILTGGGIIVKVLDALASGTPTVSTGFGNEGVGAIDGRDILIADKPDEFAAAVVRLLTDEIFAASLGASGKEFVTSNYGRELVMARHDALISELCDGK